MGKGDKRTKRGKITIGSYGKSRPHKEVAASGPATTAKSAGASAKTTKAAATKADKKKKA